MTELLTAENLVALLSLSLLEIVLGIDNIVFLAIVTSRLPAERQPSIRRIGLLMAMGQRILLLFAINWVVHLTDPLFHIGNRGVSGRDLILIGGGLFLIAKATLEINGTINGGHESIEAAKQKPASIANVLFQITTLDVVFSLDSVITAVGMVSEIAVMIAAVVIAVMIMLIFATPVSNFIVKHPSVKMLALTFLLLIGIVLVADGTGQHIDKAYIYFAMAFAIAVEFLNFRLRKKRSPQA